MLFLAFFLFFRNVITNIDGAIIKVVIDCAKEIKVFDIFSLFPNLRRKLH